MVEARLAMAAAMVTSQAMAATPQVMVEARLVMAAARPVTGAAMVTSQATAARHPAMAV
jgi:hypothetical protein